MSLGRGSGGNGRGAHRASNGRVFEVGGGGTVLLFQRRREEAVLEVMAGPVGFEVARWSACGG